MARARRQRGASHRFSGAFEPVIGALVVVLSASSARAETPGAARIERVEKDHLGRPTGPSPQPEQPAVEGPVPEMSDTAPPERSWDDDPSRIISMFTGHLGLLALPFAEVCPFVTAACEPGETGFEAGLSIYGRWYDFAIGGSFTYGLGLKPSETAGDPDGNLGREHSRTYLLLEGHFRYFFLETGDWEWFVQASAGGIIINDSWTTVADREPYNGFVLVGPQAVTVSTEGLTVGAGIGGIWQITDFWLFGSKFRYSNWILPGEREKTPVGDLASLGGRIDVIEVGVFGGFRLPL